MSSFTFSESQCKRLLEVATFTASAADQEIKKDLETATKPVEKPPVEEAKTIQIRVNAAKTGVEVVAAPVGTAKVKFAYMKNLAGEGVAYATVNYPLVSPYAPPAGFPVVDAQAANSGGTAIGGWAGRVSTTPVHEEPSHEEPKKEEPPVEPPVSKMLVSVDTGGWGGIFSEMAGLGLKYFRTSQHGGIVEEAAKAGVVPSTVIFGTGGTIGSINVSSYSAEVVAYCKKFNAFAIEVLNEPGGSWFWSDPTNYSAYVNLAKGTYEAVRAAGLKTKVLVSWDGGQGGSVSFGEHIKSAGILPYCDGVTVHPYGGSSGQNGGANGDRNKIAKAHEQSGKPVHVTEVGWPTGTGSTGDSQAWNESQQAANIKNFYAWCAAQGYVEQVVYYNLINAEDSGAAQYGVWKHTKAHKLGSAALAEAAKTL